MKAFSKDYTDGIAAAVALTRSAKRGDAAGPSQLMSGMTHEQLLGLTLGLASLLGQATDLLDMATGSDSLGMLSSRNGVSA